MTVDLTEPRIVALRKQWGEAIGAMQDARAEADFAARLVAAHLVRTGEVSEVFLAQYRAADAAVDAALEAAQAAEAAYDAAVSA